MINRLRNRQGGFTLIELLIVVAIIGIIAAILIPNLLDALQKAKQKRTVADMRNTGTAWMSWLTDQLSASAAGAAGSSTFDWTSYTALTYSSLYNLLHPTDTFFYMQEVPELDGWKFGFTFGLNGNLLNSNVMGIASGGRDGTFDNSNIVVGPFVATDYDSDIVWADGYFVAWPGGLNSAQGGS